ncbi:MAG: bifunctional precorrin-2 dehydrogenase/sirohydrochlorin ferrochelatase [Planctomycetes bacterium]|nr:bifunctional precorrin-2 dehydrogenase/sirohydrochlorin ferrochelatase [Planctomycetota bacterium]
MKIFPIMLDLNGRKVVVVGAGAVGLRRASALHKAGARVMLIGEGPAKESPKPGAAPCDGPPVVAGPYRRDMLDGAFLVFACTDDAELNAEIVRDARGIGVPANAADQVDDCDFFMPAVTTAGDVTVAVSTGGAAPALAGRLKRRLAAALPEQTGAFTSLLGELRRSLRTIETDRAKRARIMKELSNDETYNLFVSSGSQGVRKKLDQLLGNQGDSD